MDSTDASTSDNTLVSVETAHIPAQPEVVEIAPDGDVILVIGTSDNMIKLKVHSICLKLASKVFAAMFGPNWLEGKAVSKDDPKEVALPEDDPAAMRKICQILHQQVPARGEDELTATEIARIALVAEKYDMGLPLSPFIDDWLANSEIVTTEDRLLCLCATAYLRPVYTLEWMFKLVSHDTYCFSDFVNVPVLCDLMDGRMAYRLAETRMSLRAKLLDLLNQKCCDSAYGKFTRLRLKELRRVYTPSKVFEVPAMELIDKLKTVYHQKRGSKHAYITRESPEAGACPCAYKLFLKLDCIYEDIYVRVSLIPDQPVKSPRKMSSKAGK